MTSIFGRLFQVLTWGESHGKAVGCVLDGCPSDLEIDEKIIQNELDKRRPGQSEVTTSRSEADLVEILSGVFEGKTLGTPISMIVKNDDVDSSKYIEFKNKLRPSHADFTYREKYGHVDWRGGSRASARETVGRVAAGAIAGQILDKVGVHVFAYTKQIGDVLSNEILDSPMKGVGDLIYSNPIRALDSEKASEMEEQITVAKKQGDSIGGIIECVVFGIPTGVGEPTFEKLNSQLGKAVLSIPACKGIEVGDGFQLASMRGSEANDEFTLKNKKISTKTNHSGGIQGGLSNGMPIIFRCVFKPTASISRPQNTVDVNSFQETNIEVGGRHDPCIVPRAVPVVESMVKIVIVDQMMISQHIPRKFSDK